ncbi:MAG: hypothetical protein RIQ79_2630 [Verrucomicrobiota bacterium]
MAACPDLEEMLRVLRARFCRLCVVMQGMSADMADVIDAVRSASPGTKILLIANREDVDGVLPLFQRGLTDAILQPINARRAVGALQGLMGKPGLISAPADAPGRQTTGGAQNDSAYRPEHLVVRSQAMQKVMSELWAAAKDPIGVILRGEPGSEFELAAREFQAMGGDPGGYLVVLSHLEFNMDALATQVALDRLNEGMPRTYFLPEVGKLTKEQARELLDFLRRERRRRETSKPLRIVIAASVNECDPSHPEAEILEELQFIISSVVTLPALRERREDLEPLVRRILMDLTAIFPAYRARSLHPATLQWLCARPWRGNYHELVAALRVAVKDCGNRELAAGHFGNLSSSVSARPFDLEEIAADRVLAAVQMAAAPPVRT